MDKEQILELARGLAENGFIPLLVSHPLNDAPTMPYFHGLWPTETPEAGFDEVQDLLELERVPTDGLNLAIRTGRAAGIFALDISHDQGWWNWYHFNVRCDSDCRTLHLKHANGDLHAIYRYPEEPYTLISTHSVMNRGMNPFNRQVSGINLQGENGLVVVTENDGIIPCAPGLNKAVEDETILIYLRQYTKEYVPSPGSLRARARMEANNG